MSLSTVIPQALGMQDGRIKDAQITSTSTISARCLPSFARLDLTYTDKHAGGWRPNDGITITIVTCNESLYDFWHNFWTLTFFDVFSVKSSFMLKFNSSTSHSQIK